MNALEIVIIEVVKLIFFSIAWYLIARFFYPHYSKKVALDIMDDDEYVKKTQRIQETWMHAMVARETDRILDLIMARIENIDVDLSPILSQIKEIELPVGEMLEEMRVWFPKWFKGWYSGLVKADIATQREQDEEVPIMADMAKMNQGNPQAMDAIKAWAIKRNPNLGFLVQLGEMLNNGNSRSPPNQGSGGY